MTKTEKKVQVVQKKSSIGRSKKQLGSLAGLGLGKIGAKKVLVLTPSVQGMIDSVAHMIEVSEVK